MITADDLPGANLFGYDVRHRSVLVGQGEETRYVGDALALIVAETSQVAAEALKRIEVEVEVLQPLTSPLEALEQGAYLLHKGGEKSAYNSIPEAEGNICYQTRLIHGDATEGFLRSDAVVEDSTLPPARNTPTWRPKPAWLM